MKELVLQGARTYGPYALIAALVPGGTLVALFLWLYRRWISKGNTDATRVRADSGGSGAARPCPTGCA